MTVKNVLDYSDGKTGHWQHAEQARYQLSSDLAHNGKNLCRLDKKPEKKVVCELLGSSVLHKNETVAFFGARQGRRSLKVSMDTQ